MSLERLELSPLAPEANALSIELQGPNIEQILPWDTLIGFY